jgi:hypothetical protein
MLVEDLVGALPAECRSGAQSGADGGEDPPVGQRLARRVHRLSRERDPAL